jgi:alkanesulfonate monooxygenase SsuD/methylene tetrahydromethanopterin reductase-like flavin-dependent oxidoreductase (luciferase family)
MVSLDHLSQGRLVFGAGIGGGQQEWDHLGEETDLKTRGEMLDEGLAIVDGLWKGEPFSYQGKYYQTHKAQFLPRPKQSPRIPIWIGGRWPNKAPIRRSMQWDGVFPVFEAEGEAEIALITECMAYIRDLRAEMSNPFEIVYAGCPTPGDDPARAAKIIHLYRGLGFTWWLEHINPFIFGEGSENSTPLQAMQRRILQGPPRFD